MNTTITTTNADLSDWFRPGDRVRLTPDVDGMGTKVVVRAHATWLEVRPVRWYDRVRWFVQRIGAKVRKWVLWMFFGGMP